MQGLVAFVATLSVSFFSAASAADTHSFVTQTSNASTLSFLNASTGKQFSGRALGIATNKGATYAADGSIAFVTTVTKQGSALDAYSVPSGKHVGTVNILGGIGLAAAIPGTSNLFVSDYLDPSTAIYEVDGTTFTAKPVFSFGNSRIRVSALAVSPDGGTLYVSTGTALISVSTTTFRQTASVLIAGIDRIAVTPDGSLLLLAITSVSPNLVAEYNPKTKAISGSIPSDDSAYVAISPDGSSFYTTLSSNTPGPVTMLEQVSVATLAVTNSVAIPIGAYTSVGNPFAISPDGSKLAIFAQMVDPEIAFFTLPSLAPGPVTPVGNVCGVAFPTAAFVSVTNCGFDTVDVVDITAGAVKARYDAGPSPQHTLTNASGSVLYVSNLYGVWALSSTTGKILSKVEFPGPYIQFATNGQLALAADGTTLFAQNLSGGVIEIATSNNQLIGLVPGVPPGLQVSAIATSPDGKYLFVSGESELLLLNQSNGALISTVSTVAYGTGMFLLSSKDSANLYFEGDNEGFLTLCEFNVASQTFTSIPFHANEGALALSPDGTTLYVAGGSVEAVDTTTFVSTSIPSPVPAVGIAVTPDGSKLVVTSSDPELGVITIANPLIGATIPIGGGTGGISLR